MVGSGPQLLSESLAPKLIDLAKVINGPRYLRLIIAMDELVTRYESRVMIRHRNFIDTLHSLHGRAIRALTPDAMYSMVGPIDE
jgi:hypothetical protein